MTPDDYVSRVGATLRPLELRISRAIRAQLLTAFATIRASLLRRLPDDSLSRTLQYQLLRPSLEEALIPLNDALAQRLAEELWLFQYTAQDLAAEWLGEPGPPLADTPDALMRRLRFLGQELAAYFQRRSPSQFMREILRLVDRTVQRGILEGTPTAQIVEQILPEAVRGGRRALVIRRGTLVNAVRSRVDAIIAASVWQTFTGSAREVWETAITTQGQREALAWEWSAILDPRTCPVCAPLDGQRRASPDGFGVTPPVHPHCVLGDTPITTGGITAATRAIYCGNIVTVRTQSGGKFSVTAQHPVLTDHGWVRAEELTNGINLIRHGQRVPPLFDLPDLNNAPTTAAEVFQAFKASCGVTTDVVPTTPMYFHGDGKHIQGKIEVVWSDRPFQLHSTREGLEAGQKLNLIRTDPALEHVPGFSSLDLFFLALNATSNGLMGLANDALALLYGRGSHADAHRFAATTRNNPALFEPSYEHSPRTTKLLRELLNGCPELVSLDQIIDIKVDAAHKVTVYDFTTSSSIYTIGHAVSHNCRCTILPVAA